MRYDLDLYRLVSSQPNIIERFITRRVIPFIDLEFRCTITPIDDDLRIAKHRRSRARVQRHKGIVVFTLSNIQRGGVNRKAHIVVSLFGALQVEARLPGCVVHSSSIGIPFKLKAGDLPRVRIGLLIGHTSPLAFLNPDRPVKFR